MVAHLLAAANGSPFDSVKHAVNAATKPEWFLTITFIVFVLMFVLYRWWTSGCPFCAKTLPGIETLRTRYESKGLRVVGVFHPKPPRDVPAETIKEAAKKIGFEGVIAADDSWSQLKRVWLTEERPATSVSILVDAKGVIRYVHPGTMFFPSDDPKYAKENEAFRALEAAVAKVVAEAKEGRE